MTRRFALTASSLVLALAAARADVAPPPPEFANVAAGGLYFLIVRRDHGPSAQPTAQVIGCVDGLANCDLVRARGLMGRRVLGVDGVSFRPDADLREQILAAFQSKSAPATIDLLFEAPTAGGQPIRVSFARR